MDQYNNNENLYNNENQQKQVNQQPTQLQPGSPHLHPGGGTPAPYRPRKRGIGTKGIVAIILCCAVLFGGIGFGSAWYLKETGSGNTQTDAALDADTDTTEEGTTGSQSDLSLKMAKEEEGALTIPQITEKSADSVVEITT